MRERMYKTYRVERLDHPIEITADWDKGAWGRVKPLSLDLYMGQKPAHRPQTQVKLAWDTKAVYVIFRVEDRYVRATRTRHLESVCKDSCVEFFFTPQQDVTAGYLNVEANCIGTILMAHQQARGCCQRYLDVKDLDSILLAASLRKGKPIDPEIMEPITWTLEYAVPFEMLKKYAAVDIPAPGVVWRANFYKCGDETSHPHWLTWSKISVSTPDFHQPDYFGYLKFVE